MSCWTHCWWSINTSRTGEARGFTRSKQNVLVVTEVQVKSILYVQVEAQVKNNTLFQVPTTTPAAIS